MTEIDKLSHYLDRVARRIENEQRSLKPENCTGGTGTSLESLEREVERALTSARVAVLEAVGPVAELERQRERLAPARASNSSDMLGGELNCDNCHRPHDKPNENCIGGSHPEQ